MSWARRVSIALVMALALGAVATEAASAHPLGNFTVNRFSAIEVYPDRVVVHYVVDMAEVPSFQALRVVDANADDRATSTELSVYARTLAAEIRGNIELMAGDAPVELALEDARAGLRTGQGGLDVIRVDLRFGGSIDDASTTLNYVDRNYRDRLGWKEIVSYGTGGQGIVKSTVPSESVSNELRSYPQEQLSLPVNVSEATIRVTPGAAPAPSNTRTDTSEVGPGDLFAGAFASLVGGDMSPAFLVFAVMLAAAAGALHALGPGHGKTVMAAYLVGSEGRVRHAVAVGVAISLMHTISVVVLGLLTLWATGLFPPETVYPYLSLISGAAVLSLGAWLLSTRVRSHRRRRRDAHHHSHDHGHEHDHGIAHLHGPDDHTHGPVTASGSPLSWKGLVALALSGGLLPSPTALVALLGAVALHRVAFGVTLVAAFSIGLAGALTLLGMLVLRARGFAARRMSGPRAALIPIGSAALILGMGLFLTTRAAVGL